jgi:EAL domain-containing protein (putative c-di-GMP-specific phosphodiesterase class I)
LALADAACSQAKGAGRNCVHFVLDEFSAQSARSKMDWVTRIAQALEEDRFRLYCQPIVPLDAAAAPEARVEILVRMLDTDGSIILPSRFIPSAEQYNLIGQIDRRVIALALPALAPMALAGSLQSVSINLSGGTLRDSDLATYILQYIETSGMPPGALCFEITETVAASEYVALKRLMKRLRRIGVRFAIDDFGTGSSSLALLKSISVEYLKIDGSFVRTCATERADVAIIDAIVRLSSALGLQTVAEYVSDDEVVRVLRAIGVTYGQGWAFGKAVPVEELVPTPMVS